MFSIFRDGFCMAFQERLSTDKDYLLQIARDVAKVAIGIEKGTVDYN